MAGWDTLQKLVQLEILQRAEEGCDVVGFQGKLEAAGNELQLMNVYEEVARLSVKEEFPYEEPNDWNEIQKQRPKPVNEVKKSIIVEEQFHGAWLGRSAGCALGKPLETTDFFLGNQHHPGWKNVELWFKGADAWPITGYTPGHSSAEQEWGIKINEWCQQSFRENIRFMESDDDIRYTVIGLLLLEEKGRHFDSWDIGKLWHKYLTYQQVCTAETQAYFNFAHVTTHMKGNKPADWTEKNVWVRTYLNPYREWIGAQIRADIYGYAAAGNPEFAAELAYRDASFSHVKNGIYGSLFVAAMVSAAFVEKDNERIVEIGLNQIPEKSRLAEAIKKAIDIAKNSRNQEEVVSKVWDAFHHYDPVHTINNAALVAAALIYGRDDFEKVITTAVYGGWDTDCNGATVGSIMGAKLGATNLPSHWVKPLNDTLYAEIVGFHPISISTCAKRTFEVFKKIDSQP
ncbi:MAG: ADP-ribosylglycohydrolase family protein [Bacillus sp. (in: firmicutes)]